MTIFSLLLATVISAGIVPRQPKFSMFASDVFDAAKTSGHTVRETVSKLKTVGITGFDAEYCGRTIDELKAAGSSHAAGLTAGAGLRVKNFKLGAAYARYHYAYSSLLFDVAYSF